MYCLVLKQPAVQFCSDHSAINIYCPNRWLSTAYIALSVPLKYIIGGIQYYVVLPKKHRMISVDLNLKFLDHSSQPEYS